MKVDFPNPLLALKPFTYTLHKQKELLEAHTHTKLYGNAVDCIEDGKTSI